jgi:hypothetical protein
VGPIGQRKCRHAQVVSPGGGTAVPEEQARSSAGVCGPDARLLDMASWH